MEYRSKDAGRPERRNPRAAPKQYQNNRGSDDDGRSPAKRLPPKYEKQRRETRTFETLGRGAEMVGQGAKKAAKGLSSWFGITDQPQMQQMQQNYVTRKKMSMVPGAVMGPLRRQPRPSMATDPEMLRLAMQMANASSSSEGETEEPEIVVNSTHFTRDLTDGLTHYQSIRKVERQCEIKPGWLGGEVNQRRNSSQGYRTMGHAPKRKHTHVIDDTLVKLQLIQMREYYPYFIYFLTGIQALVAIAMGFHAYTTDDFAPWGLATVVVDCSDADPNNVCPNDFAEQQTVINKTVYNNWSFGPTNKYLIDYGAKFAPCMREDSRMLLNAAYQRQAECIYQISVTSEVGYTCDESLLLANATNIGMACCRLQIMGRAAMTSYDDCVDFHSAAGEPFGSTSWSQGDTCNDNQDYIYLRPCCVGLGATCELLTEEQCEYKSGFWNRDKMLCADTMCLSTHCKFMGDFGGPQVEAASTFRNQPSSPNQWYRFVLPLLIHGGAAHTALALLVQLYIGRTVEKQSGFARTFLIYFIAGIGGNLVSGIFSPETVSMGADPAIYGLLGVQIVDLFQSWQIVPKPIRVLLKLTVIIAVSLLIGTFPYVDNWSHIGGFVFGLISAVVFLPFITFGRWDARRKKILLAICIPTLLMMTLMSILMFYLIQTTDFCPWCINLNCIAYTPEIDCSLQA